jgi:hypothetical protein
MKGWIKNYPEKESAEWTLTMGLDATSSLTRVPARLVWVSFCGRNSDL